jgi:hypothetical protein
MGSRGAAIFTGAVLTAAVLTGGGAAGASATSRVPHQPSFRVGAIKVLRQGNRLHMSQSGNWSGYNQGVVDEKTPFRSISGQWVVPTATQRVKGQAEYSASWTGIGGGCLDRSCDATDATLIQAGTEQDVSKNGTAHYSTWWEVIPAPSFSTPVTVRPGNVVSVSLTESAPDVWTISIRNLSTGSHWSKTVPYSSDYSTAEWIEETPLLINGAGSGFTALPNLGAVHFDQATVNGRNAGLAGWQRIQLTNSAGHPLATPSNPDSDANGFADCSYASVCTAPTS